MSSSRRWPSRRTFLTSAALAGAAGVMWDSFPLRFIRGRMAELGRDVPSAPHTPDPRTWSDNGITLAWLGHATVLINFYGVRILTDPTLFSRIGIDAWIGSIGPLRLTACALGPDALPDIDLLLVSHAHFDHLDTPSLATVTGRPAVVMASRTSDLLPRGAYASVRELRWNEHASIVTPRGDVHVRAVEVRHWGARLQHDTYRGYNGYIVEREGRALLIGGDTADTPLFTSYKRYAPFEAAVMPIGAYDPWIRNHCTPEQAVRMADAAGARLFVPVHHQSFQLSREPMREPIERAQTALKSEADRLALRDVGETVRIL